MKVIYTLMFSLLATMSWAQNNKIFSAIEKGVAQSVIELMDESIELCFDERVEFLSKKEARMELKRFFEANPPKNFKRVHGGNSPGADSKYVIGKYSSTNGKKFRVYIFAKRGKDKQLIQELRFDTL